MARHSAQRWNSQLRTEAALKVGYAPVEVGTTEPVPFEQYVEIARRLGG